MLELREMTEKEFSVIQQEGIQSYAEEKKLSEKISLTEAIVLAEVEFQQLLPNGLSTSKNYFYIVEEKDQAKGYIWVASYYGSSEIAFIYDIFIYSSFQNQGFGTEAIRLAEKRMKECGYKFLQLHVFGNNQRAIHVYEKLGFKPTDITMRKEL